MFFQTLTSNSKNPPTSGRLLRSAASLGGLHLCKPIWNDTFGNVNTKQFMDWSWLINVFFSCVFFQILAKRLDLGVCQPTLRVCRKRLSAMYLSWGLGPKHQLDEPCVWHVWHYIIHYRIYISLLCLQIILKFGRTGDMFWFSRAAQSRGAQQSKVHAASKTVSDSTLAVGRTEASQNLRP